MRRSPVVLTFVLALCIAPASAQGAAPGGFKQLPNPFGCLQNGGDGVTCGAIGPLVNNYRTALSPDGKNLYATGLVSNTLLVFDRNATTGALTQKAGKPGCFINGADTTGCTGTRLLIAPGDLQVSPDGDTLWVAASGGAAVLTFTRNTTTGTVQQKTGLDGCVADSDGTCRDGRALTNPTDLAVTDDGENLYAANASGSVTALSATADGVLSQLDDAGGYFGCIEDAASADNCQDGGGLVDVRSVDVTPDGKNLYAGAPGGERLVAIDRQTGGRIRMSTSAHPCYATSASTGCTALSELGNIYGVLVDPTGTRVYTANSGTHTLIVFDRQSDGGLLRHAGTSGCLAAEVRTGCLQIRGMVGAEGLAMSADRAHLYLASTAFGSLAELRVISGGGLSPNPNPSGCAFDGPTNDNCTGALGTGGAADVQASPDGRYLYLSGPSANAIAIFKRDSAAPTCSNGSQTLTAGQTVSLQLTCSDADGDAQTVTILEPPALGALGVVDQTTRRVAFASSGVAGTTSFRYRTRSNGIDSNTATYTIHVNAAAGPGPAPGPGPGPAPPPPPTVLPSTTSIASLAFVKYTKLQNLAVKNLQPGSTVVVTCKTKTKKQQQTSCPYKSKRFTTSGARASLNLRKPFKKKKLPVGTKITLTITAPGFLGKRITYTVRARKVPKSKVQCISASGKAGSCG